MQHKFFAGINWQDVYEKKVGFWNIYFACDLYKVELTRNDTVRVTTVPTAINGCWCKHVSSLNSLSRRLSPKLPQRRTQDILTKSSQDKSSPLRHPDKVASLSHVNDRANNLQTVPLNMSNMSRSQSTIFYLSTYVSAVFKGTWVTFF